MRTLGALFGLTLASMLAACEGPPCYVSVERFAITSPDADSELLPGEPVRWEWDPDSIDEDVTMSLSLRGANRIVGISGATLAQGGIAVLREDATMIPQDVYEIEVTFGRCDQPIGTYVSDTRVFAQGVTFADTGIIIASDETPRWIGVNEVSLTTMDVELYLDPSTTTDGDELRFAASTVQGAMKASYMTYPFTGMTTDGAPIPAGDYQAFARVHARDGITYDMPGPWLRWVVLP